MFTTIHTSHKSMCSLHEVQWVLEKELALFITILWHAISFLIYFDVSFDVSAKAFIYFKKKKRKKEKNSIHIHRESNTDQPNQIPTC